MGIINSPSYADYMVEGEAEEHTEELEVQQPPATTSAPAKKMTVILSASSSKTSSKKQPSTGKDLSTFSSDSFILNH